MTAVVTFTKAIRRAGQLICALLVGAIIFTVPAPASAQQTVRGEEYIPGIWIDPDGCEHWVMDDGAEGYMSPHVNRQGVPVCRRGNVCGVMNSDQYFATDSHRISAAGRAQLENFFRSTTARAFVIAGHTDSRASDEYNMRLSYNRANAVARVASGVGARVVDVRGYGERMPKAANSTAAGMAQNRRVEIICIQ
ncbi:OmpA family protein [Lutimaribacter sp. EGI FJ00015]|uniref:OmpA family protein n=1 Tax=Lutimaribacter degradans TaxID=2945989 RepID=A0ACC5ZXF9_9RHOB|nr:OmpA family protein [Lutimaribacter sp. EGI FJ00013]MCM2563017.1 OmpA family protein [Lutimaribacter sp. EGI FJ00013]MCO0614185.1 OmpA family protein [Lutimaribacter sp. EGI FJ00015]MCO0636162.1 OmpA family protein [Lutimaribacter sp. EGI FJ00014]